MLTKQGSNEHDRWKCGKRGYDKQDECLSVWLTAVFVHWVCKNPCQASKEQCCARAFRSPLVWNDNRNTLHVAPDAGKHGGRSQPKGKHSHFEYSICCGWKPSDVRLAVRDNCNISTNFIHFAVCYANGVDGQMKWRSIQDNSRLQDIFILDIAYFIRFEKKHSNHKNTQGKNGILCPIDDLPLNCFQSAHTFSGTKKNKISITPGPLYPKAKNTIECQIKVKFTQANNQFALNLPSNCTQISRKKIYLDNSRTIISQAKKKLVEN